MSFFIREDPLTGERCIIASVRSRRPHVIKEVIEEEPFQCPFCPGNESLTPRESFRIEGDSGFSAIPHMHDVIVDSPEHRDDLDTIEHLDKLLWTYKERLIYYYNLENVLRKEMELRERVLSVSKNFAVLLAYAPATPYEIWIVPREKVNSFVFESRFEELAEVTKEVIVLLKNYLGADFSYNLTLQSAPPWDRDYHYYLRVLPRVSVFGGFELETGNVIVSVAPEEAAIELRAVKYARRSE